VLVADLVVVVDVVFGFCLDVGVVSCWCVVVLVAHTLVIAVVVVVCSWWCFVVVLRWCLLFLF